MSDETPAATENKTIAALNRRIEELIQDLAETRSEAKDRRLANKELQKQLDDATGKITALTTERDTFKTQLESAPSALRDENERLKGELRTRDHKEAFVKAAKTANVREDALGDLWDLSRYKAEGDKPDEAKITASITEALKTRAWMIEAPATSTTAETAAAAPGGAQTQAAAAAAAPIQVQASARGPGAGKTGDAPPPAAKNASKVVDQRWAKSGSAHDDGRL